MQVTDADIRLFRVLCTPRSILPRRTISFYAKPDCVDPLKPSMCKSSESAAALLEYAEREIALNSAILQEELNKGEITHATITCSANLYGFKLQ